MAETEILLESGTNEIEIMQFTIFGELYGINVAKVREIMMADKVKPVPHSHEAVEGIFKPREILLTVIDLPKYLTGDNQTKNPRDLFIITNFNKMHIAFRVHSVVGISRISWEDIQKPDNTISHGEEGVATGIAQCGSNLVTILDFEKIVAEIAPETTIQMDEIDKLGERQIRESQILLAEDSILLSRMIKDSLVRAGYVNITSFNNGKEAWDYLQAIRNDSDFDEKAGLLITDIEMPEMDGHRLTKLVKEDEIMQRVPIIIFSSLINQEMRIKGKQLGADEQMSKPEIGHLVEVMDELLARKEARNG
ncbi:MAG: chemotaxis protein CheV [Lachnospiraceae bacterium]|nr:chemotaxis protein CheV [Lachnospiraceae bacterium]